VINQTAVINLYPNSGNAFIVRGVNARDSFGLHFELVENTTNSGQPGQPGSPVAEDQPLPNIVTYAQLMSADPLLGVFNRYCVTCHNAVNRGGNLNLTNQAEASSRAATILSRMRNPANPMPRSGVLEERLVRIVEIWVQGGTP
jgi:hypothetical protein